MTLYRHRPLVFLYSQQQAGVVKAGLLLGFFTSCAHARLIFTGERKWFCLN